MSKGHLRVVGDDERPPAVAKNLVEAVELTRRELLSKARETIATTIDAGVPAHALARLLSEMNAIDSEIRRIDAADEQERQHQAKRRGPDDRRKFDSAAV